MVSEEVKNLHGKFAFLANSMIEIYTAKAVKYCTEQDWNSYGFCRGVIEDLKYALENADRCIDPENL